MDAEQLRARLGLINAPSLELLRQRMVKAEADLEAARDAMRKAADAAGIKRGGLFVGSKFVERTAGERWAAEARAAGHLAGSEWLATALEKAGRPDGPFAHITRAMLRRGVDGRDTGRGMADAPVDPVEARQQEILASRRTDLSPNKLIGAPTTSAELVSAIHAAAAKARSATGSHKDDQGPMNALSKAVVEAGRTRRRMSGEEK